MKQYMHDRGTDRLIRDALAHAQEPTAAEVARARERSREVVREHARRAVLCGDVGGGDPPAPCTNC